MKHDWTGRYRFIDISSFLWIDKNELSLEKIENSEIIASDSEGNETRAIWSEDQNCHLLFFVEIPQPLTIPTLSEINNGEQQ